LLVSVKGIENREEEKKGKKKRMSRRTRQAKTEAGPGVKTDLNLRKIQMHVGGNQKKSHNCHFPAVGMAFFG